MIFRFRHSVLLLLVVCCNINVLLVDGTVSDRTLGISGQRLGHTIWKDVNEGMGRQKIQAHFDKSGAFTSKIPKWSEIVKQMAEKTGQKFKNLIAAVRILRNATQHHYDTDETQDISTNKCCDKQNANYDNDFKTEVDKQNMCIRFSDDSNLNSLNLPGQSLLTSAQKNLQDVHFLKWQYMGTEGGGTMLYPAFHTNCSYEARTRPWYVETFAPEQKDIVIVVDGTENHESHVDKEAVLTIIDTTNPNDRIGVIKFWNRARTPEGDISNSTCYQSNLALATPLNKEYLRWFVIRPESRRLMKQKAEFQPALESAFEFFKEKTNSTEKRRKILLFFTHSNPKDPQPKDILRKVRELNERNGNNTTILTFASGIEQLSNDTQEILQNLATDTKCGAFTVLNGTKNLRYKLRSYYDTLSKPLEHPLFVLPYVDLWGLGIVISICLPLHSKGQFKGVVCIDGTLKDLLSDVTNLNIGPDAYFFIVDSQGRTIHHPYLSRPSETKKTSLNVHISMLERGEGVQKIIAAIASGEESGEKDVRVSIPKDKATFPGQWVEMYESRKHYQWTKIPHTNYTLCIVSTGNDIQLNIKRITGATKKYFNPFFLGTSSNQCLHEKSLSTMKSSVTLEPKVFRKECSYPTKEDEAKALERYFLSDRDNQVPQCLTDHARQEVIITGQVETIWKEECWRYNHTILWWHLVTFGGVMRIYPAANITYDPLTLPFYVKALAHPETIILSQAQTHNKAVIVISQVIHEGRTSKLHSRHDIPFAVVAAQFTYTYILKSLHSLFPSCGDDRYSCFLVDESGQVLLHSNFTSDDIIYNGRRLGHILDMDPSIAHYLRTKNMLVSDKCIIAEKFKIQEYWKISIPAGIVNCLEDDPSFEMHSVPGTNIFIIRKNRSASTERLKCKPCMHSGDISACLDPDITRGCDCPCYSNLQFDFCNYTFPRANGPRLPSTCPLSVLPTMMLSPPTTELNLPPCIQEVVDCSRVYTRSDCNLLPPCSWCSIAKSDDLVCALPDQCSSRDKPTRINAVAAGICITLLILLILLIIVVTCYLWRKGRLPKCFEGIGKNRTATRPNNGRETAPGGQLNEAFEKEEENDRVIYEELKRLNSVNSEVPDRDFQQGQTETIPKEIDRGRHTEPAVGHVVPQLPLYSAEPRRKPPPLPKATPTDNQGAAFTYPSKEAQSLPQQPVPREEHPHNQTLPKDVKLTAHSPPGSSSGETRPDYRPKPSPRFSKGQLSSSPPFQFSQQTPQKKPDVEQPHTYFNKEAYEEKPPNDSLESLSLHLPADKPNSQGQLKPQPSGGVPQDGEGLPDEAVVGNSLSHPNSITGPSSRRTDPEGEETDQDMPYFQQPHVDSVPYSPDSGLGQGSPGDSETFLKQVQGTNKKESYS